MHLVGFGCQVNFCKQALVIGVARPAGVFLFKHQRVLALDGVALRVVLAVFGHLVDEEQAEHLHAAELRHAVEALFLVQMLLDRAADHFPRNRPGIHVAPSLAHAQEFFVAGYF